MQTGRAILLLAALLALGPAGQAARSPELTMDFPRLAGTVGDRFPLTLTLQGAGDPRWTPDPLPEELGPFRVLGGDWSLLDGEPGKPAGWVWEGVLAAFETGELELPPVTVVLRSGEEELERTTEPVMVTIESVLDPGEQDAEIADLKDPATVEPDYRALMAALAVLTGLLAAAAVARSVQRRLAGRLAAVPQPVDPFRRLPAHEWAYQALQELLAGGHADPEHAGTFFQEIARILKIYLGHRYRVDLMECTTAEALPALAQAGAGPETLERAGRILSHCDMVKFAAVLPEPAGFRAAVEEAYALIDRTRPEDASGKGAA